MNSFQFLVKKAIRKANIESEHITTTTPVVIISDLHLHLGQPNSGADDSSQCKEALYAALDYYADQGYILVINGDLFDIAESVQQAQIVVPEFILHIQSMFESIFIINGNHDPYPDLLKMLKNYNKIRLVMSLKLNSF